MARTSVLEERKNSFQDMYPTTIIKIFKKLSKYVLIIREIKDKND